MRRVVKTLQESHGFVCDGPEGIVMLAYSQSKRVIEIEQDVLEQMDATRMDP